MFLVVGLGNPGDKYDGTRHNIGFEAIDYISSKYNIDVTRVKFKGVIGEGFIGGEKVILLKPTTYMNLSGESVREAMSFYKLTEEDIVIIYDDISLEVGKIRIREKGSAGGHNGIKSIISNINTDVFPRIKIGVGQPTGDLVSHVLGRFSKEESEDLKEVIEVSSKAVEIIMKSGTKDAMNELNGFKLSKKA
ncbi:MAG: aminoacyl-tRNA hydrolase [Clostridium sp.]|uniref:aminoacyl-tRNA hydrolase n=1 Tax=Clostridium sp. TaxID=1506 RepID=UPI002914D08D|nr:aminoacyl-tRNA hydrolase [Clostridium sp.]MDU5109816.1 aminoacyl-tRNA hydrolase [Clostridium sp.]